MPYALSQIKVKKLDLVSDPANHRTITLFKSGANKVKKEEILAALKDLSDDDRAEMVKALGMKDDPLETIKAMTDEQKAELRKALMGDDKGPTAEQILKALETALRPKDDGEWEGVPEAVQKAVKGFEGRVKKAEDRADKSDADLAKMREAQQRAAYIEKASAFKDLPGANPDDLAPILESAAEHLTKAQYDKLEAILKGSVEAIKTSALYGEIGSHDIPEGSARAELQSKVAELRKADSKLTEAAAEDRILEEDAALSTRVMDEERESATSRARR